MGYHNFFIVDINNYSEKSVMVAFGFTNKYGKQKESTSYFVPKQFIKEINFKDFTITIQHFWFKMNGHLWRYRIDKAFKKPKRLNILLDTFLEANNLKYAQIDNIKIVY